jgi:integrase/recombinase XerD
MLTLYRRHTKKCSHRTCRRNRCAVAKKRADGQITKCACACPIWVDGFHNGGEIRRSLRQSTWDDAVEVLETLKDNKGQSVRPEPITIENAKEKFLDDMEHRGLAEVTIYKYRIMFKQLEALAIARGLRYLKELDLDQLTEFRAGWKDGPRSSVKKLERLRAWLAICHEREWISKNPAKNLRSPKVKDRPTLPFPSDEMVKIFAALDTKYAKRAGRRNAQRLKAFVLMLRYSGLRIGDAVSSKKDRIQNGKIFIYTQKTGTPVRCPLPQTVTQALDASPHSSEEYFFWSGKSTLKAAVGKWQRRLHTLFELAGILGGHAHRFRDTFAVELLLQGTPIERVSVLLGHRSVRITEKHYSPWVRARQEQLEADLVKTWEGDPVLDFAGTSEVHEKTQRRN